MASGVWFTAAEIAALALPGLPASKRNVNDLADRQGWRQARNSRGEPLCRPRAARGGGFEFHISLLPAAARQALAPKPQAAAKPSREDLWAAFERLPAPKRAEAERRVALLARVEELAIDGGRVGAVLRVCAESGVSKATLYGWFKLVEGLDRADRLPALAPQHKGGRTKVEVDIDLLDILTSDYLRPEEPSLISCYRRVEEIAAERGVACPELAIMRRRMKAKLSASTIIAHRKGKAALKATFPHQVRDRSIFLPTDAYVADTHIWDVLVQWEDGSIGRPATIGVQDLASNKIVAHRTSQSETTEVVSLTFGDAFRDYGIPNDFWLDNSRVFASKQLTGGQKTRYRFKRTPGEIQGMLTALGVTVHFTTPYSGQSKPIERSWRDFAGDIAKHPIFAGAYTGPSTTSKPANYGSAAVPIDLFKQVIASEIAKWNARGGRRTPIAKGRSFDEVFAEGYAKAAVRRATPEQLRICMLQVDTVTPHRQSGTITVGGNRFWSDALVALRHERVMVRFDPMDLHSEVHVYTLDGRFVATAPCLEEAGFKTSAEDRDFHRTRRAALKAQLALADIEKKYSDKQIAAMQIRTAERPVVAEAPNVVAPVFGGRIAHGSLALATTPVAPQPQAEILTYAEREKRAEEKRRAQALLRLARND